MKFKVGDRVKFVKSIIYHTKAVKLGGIYTVKTIDNKNKQYLVGCENKHGEFFEEEELALAEYTYEDLKKSPIGTKVIFKDGIELVRESKKWFCGSYFKREMRDLMNLKDNYNGLGKIVKIEEPEYKTVYEHKPEILDEAEKRYLRGVIRPFRDKVEEIKKEIICLDEKDEEGIRISLKDGQFIRLPRFKPNTMYKNMNIYKNYTLKELGL